ncbi:TonB-dependent receptor [Halocola ammonii]
MKVILNRAGYLIILLLFTQGFAFSQSGEIKGVVTNEKNNEPIPFANVVIQGESSGASTDIDGKYSLTGLKPGLYNLEVTSIGFKKETVFEIQVTNARPAVVNVKMQETAVQTEAAEVVASRRSNREESPVSVRSIGVNEIRRNPGGNRDISQAIRSLPGVASTPAFRNDVIIRGGSPNENRFFIDGIEIPNINHFATQGASGGPVGLINVDLVKNVDFYSGAFPTNRGNALSSVLEFGFKDPRTDQFTLNAVVGSSDLGVTVEGPISENTGLIFSARRSYLQFLFEALQLPFLPTYNDFQFKLKSQISENDQITVIGLGAIDQFNLNLSLAEDSTSEDFRRNDYILGYLPVSEQWNYSIGAKWDHFTENGRWTTVMSRNMLNNSSYKYRNNNENLPKVSDYLSQEIENKLRIEKQTFGEDSWEWNYGVNYEYAKYNNSSAFEQYSYALDTVVNINFSSDLKLHKYGVFGQVSKKVFDQRLSLSLGVRAVGNDYTDRMANPLNQLSPRFSASYALAPQWTLNFNTGIYHQLPPYTVLGYRQNGVLVNQQNDVSYIRNKQLVLGTEYNWDKRNSTISVEGFYKDYDNYPLSVDKGISLANLGADFGVIGNEEVVSVSQGRAYGAEFLYQQKLFSGFYGILSYTWVRSEFTGRGDEYVPSSWDSRHLISLTGGKKFKKNWEVGFRFLFSGGLPYTPYDIGASVAIPNWQVNMQGLPDYTRLNERRIDPFHQLDIRIDKKWFFEKWSLNLFLDVQNVYNQVTPLQPYLTVKEGPDGQPVEDPNNPGSYQPVFLDTSNGNVLPSIGIIVEL